MTRPAALCNQRYTGRIWLHVCACVRVMHVPVLGVGGGSKRPRGVDTVMWRLNIALSSGVTIDEKTIV